ncbi:MAG: polyprenyl synthetase family protein [Microgenomates group bacterium]|jgi:geranylgeranyl diphosphate synthase type I
MLNLAQMDFKNYLQIAAEEINQEMDSIFTEWSSEVGVINNKLIPLNQAFIEACSGGKRLRGALVKLGYEIASGKETKDILKPAVAVEIFQTAILAHDDIIDKSLLRRGKPTLYKVLGGDHHGISQTICLGDIGFFLTMKLLTDNNFPEKIKNSALNCFARTTINTGWGEVLDVELPYLKGEKTASDVLTIFKLKTAEYTITGPMQMGAILGGAEQMLLKDIEEFGTNLGIAFQIQDDILGVFGKEETIGKPVTSDIEEGKLTLMIIHAREKASEEQNKILDKYYGKENIGDKELDAIRKVFKDTGAPDYSQKKAEELVDIAKKIIPQITKDSEKAKLLEEMADFLVKRIN